MTSGRYETQAELEQAVDDLYRRTDAKAHKVMSEIVQVTRDNYERQQAHIADAELVRRLADTAIADCPQCPDEAYAESVELIDEQNGFRDGLTKAQLWDLYIEYVYGDGAL